MSPHPDEHAHRSRFPQVLVVVAGLLQRTADVAVIWFTFSPANSMLLLRGLAIGGLLCTSVLLIGVWRRLRWARYVLTGFNWGYIAVFGFRALQVWSEEKPSWTDPPAMLLAGVLFYAAANVILIRSRRVRHYANR